MNEIIEEIKKENVNKINSNKKLPRFKTFKSDFNISTLEYEIISTLGIWEVEDEKPHKLFLTYGAKKYGYIDFNNKVKTTIAGCNKKNIPRVINNVADKNNMSLQDAFLFTFACGTTFDESASGRTTSWKEKRNVQDFLDMTYDNKKINQFGGIIIKDTTYTLNMTLKDSEIIGHDETDLSLVKIDIEGNIKYE